MKPPRKIKQKTLVNRFANNPTYDHTWVGCHFPDERACVAGKIIVDNQPDVRLVYHMMREDCACPENSDKTVLCYTEMQDGTCFKMFHKPGQCPYLVYKEG